MSRRSIARTKQRGGLLVAQSLPVPQAAAPTRTPTGMLLAVMIISMAIMGYEVTLTRVFAVLLRYHFAFLVISVALCGLGLGGFVAHWWRRRPLPMPALGFSLGIPLSLLIILRLIFTYIPNAYWLAALVLLAPFTCAGAFLAEVFSRYAVWSGRLYAWDLLGAAVVAVGSVGLLQLVDAIDACLLMAVLAAVAAVCVADTRRARLTSGVWVLGCAIVLAGNFALRVFDIPPIPPHFNSSGQSLADTGLTQPLFTELGDPKGTSHIVATRWNAFARTDVVADTIVPDANLIYTNGNVPTNMLHWDGQVARLPAMLSRYPLCDLAFATAPLGRGGTPCGTVLSIGPGGGLDALLALRYNAKRFEGAELNPSIVKLMEEFKSYNGGIYRRPNVSVVTADGRSYVRERAAQGQRYALIYSALTKTATAGQGLALLESYIHTQNAVTDYLQALQNDGRMVWLVDRPELLARLYATALAALADDGKSTVAGCGHLALLHDPHSAAYQFALILQKTPFTPAQTAELQAQATARKLNVLWLPDQPSIPLYQAMASGHTSMAQFIAAFAHLPNSPALDVRPCTDDKPFVLDLSPGILPIFTQLTALALVLALIVVVLGWRAGWQSGQQVTGRDVLFVLYFLTLGLGFMLVEIPLIQKLILPLGYPTLALAVILFSLLLGGGLGSAVSQRSGGSRLWQTAQLATLGVAVITLADAVVLGLLPALLVGVSLPVRCLLVSALLLPLGFLLGMPFPTGMRLFASQGAVQVPLIWGLNGVASVVGSLTAAMGAKLIGFSAVLALGAVVYLFAGLLLFVLRRYYAGKSKDKRGRGHRQFVKAGV